MFFGSTPGLVENAEGALANFGTQTEQLIKGLGILFHLFKGHDGCRNQKRTFVMLEQPLGHFRAQVAKLLLEHALPMVCPAQYHKKRPRYPALFFVIAFAPADQQTDTIINRMIPMDEDHPVDDCIGLLIGGRERYYGEQCRVAGTFFMIPGWTTHWKRMFERECGNLSEDMARRLFKDYERSLLISTPIMSLEEMKQNSKAFSELFDLRTEVCKGTLGILHKTWDTAKQYLNSNND